jgi:hypothetical protein
VALVTVGARGIERRTPRVIRPRRWAVLSYGRGVLGPPGDRAMLRDNDVHAVLAELDGRAGEDQPTTA